MSKELLPIVLVTGFLGAGKTTFMRRLLKDAQARGLRAGVVINEFGVADIDGSILRESGAELVGELAGGCACCSSQDEMIWTLIELGRLPREEQPDVILMESSGLADPLVMLDGLTVAALLPLVRVASVVSVVDTVRLPEMRTAEGAIAPLLQRQVGLADTVIGSKADLAFKGIHAEERRETAESIIRSLNPHARLEFARAGEVDFDPIWERVASSETAHTAPNAGEAVHGHAQTIVVPVRKPTTRERLEAALQDLGPDVWRGKGFVRLQGDEDLFLVQYVGLGGGSYEIDRFEARYLNAMPPTELVFIGPALDRAALWKAFAGEELLLLGN